MTHWHAVLSQMGFQHQIYDADGNGIAGVYDYTGTEEAKRNAYLIAAAPTMLAVLRDIHDFLRSSGYDTRMVQAVLNETETGTADPLGAARLRLEQAQEDGNG